MEKPARIVSKDERKAVRYIRKEASIPNGWDYDGVVTLDESHFKAVNGVSQPVASIVQEIPRLEPTETLGPPLGSVYNIDPAKGGIKKDEGKNRLELIHPDILFAI
ncbi:hypothetical protein LCGC14_2735280, partial [marine sediment metagenome]